MTGNNKKRIIPFNTKPARLQTIPLESPSSQKSSPAAWLLSSRATIKPMGCRRLKTQTQTHAQHHTHTLLRPNGSSKCTFIYFNGIWCVHDYVVKMSVDLYALKWVSEWFYSRASHVCGTLFEGINVCVGVCDGVYLYVVVTSGLWVGRMAPPLMCKPSLSAGRCISTTVLRTATCSIWLVRQHNTWTDLHFPNGMFCGQENTWRLSRLHWCLSPGCNNT